ncbi:MAG: O-antigen ligase family protein [Mucilaginibacter sp.]
MKNILLTQDSLTNKITFYHLAFLLASLPFDRFFSHVILISFALHLLIHLKRASVKPIFTVRNLILTSVFFITAISTIYTTEPANAYSELGRHVTILLFPVLFCLTSFDLKKYQPKLLLGFAVVCALTIVYLYIYAFYLIRHYGLPYNAIFSQSFTNHNFSAPIDMHATFFSMQIAVALIYLISILVKQKLNRGWYILCAVILVIGLIQLCSKSVFVTLLLIVNLGIPYFLLQQKRRLKYLFVALSFTALIGIIIYAVPVLRQRYITDLHTDLSSSAKGRLLEPRVARWGEAVKLIKQAPLIGHGAGTEVPMLHESFFKQKYYSSFLKNLNAHNQYLSFLFKAGIWGLLVYACTLIYGFRVAVKKHDLLFFTFMLLIALVSVSENLLDVDKGVFFYAFFFSFFMFSTDDKSISVKA